MLEKAELEVRREVWSALAGVRGARELVNAAATQLADAKESMRRMSERYKVGAATMTDLLDAQSALTSAEALDVQSRWNSRLADAVLMRALGTLAAGK